MIYSLGDKKPELGEDVWIAPDAMVVGDVVIGEGSSVWFGSIIRGDVNFIRIGKNCNIQDLSMLHVQEHTHPLILGDHISLGHRVTLHGCTLADHSFVGIGATMLNGSSLGEFSLLAAGSLLPEGKSVPPGMLAMGIPAKVVRPISDREREMILRVSEKYAVRKREYMDPDLFKPF